MTSFACAGQGRILGSNKNTTGEQAGSMNEVAAFFGLVFNFAWVRATTGMKWNGKDGQETSCNLTEVTEATHEKTWRSGNFSFYFSKVKWWTLIGRVINQLAWISMLQKVRTIGRAIQGGYKTMEVLWCAANEAGPWRGLQRHGITRGIDVHRNKMLMRCGPQCEMDRKEIW